MNGFLFVRRHPMVTVGSISMLLPLAIGLNGGTEPNMGARTHELQQTLSLSDTGLGITLAGWGIGMVVAGTVTGRIIKRLGPRRTLRLGAIGFISFGFVGLASSAWQVFLALFGTGVGFALLDVALYRTSTHLEEQRGGELVNQRAHAGYALGSLAGSVLGFGAGALSVSLGWHLMVIAAVTTAVTLYVARRLPDVREPDQPGATETEDRARPPIPREVRLASVIAGASVLMLIIGTNWSGVLLERLGAASWIASLGVLAYTCGTFVSRMAAHRFTTPNARTGRVLMTNPALVIGVYGSLVAAAGILLIAAPGRIDAAIVGFFLLGVGLGATPPLAQSAATRLMPEAPGRAVAFEQRYIYYAIVLAYVVGPLADVIGSDESAVPLQIALGTTLLCPALVVVLHPVLRHAQPEQPLAGGEQPATAQEPAPVAGEIGRRTFTGTARITFGLSPSMVPTIVFEDSEGSYPYRSTGRTFLLYDQYGATLRPLYDASEGQLTRILHNLTGHRSPYGMQTRATSGPEYAPQRRLAVGPGKDNGYEIKPPSDAHGGLFELTLPFITADDNGNPRRIASLVIVEQRPRPRPIAALRQRVGAAVRSVAQNVSFDARINEGGVRAGDVTFGVWMLLLALVAVLGGEAPLTWFALATANVGLVAAGAVGRIRARATGRDLSRPLSREIVAWGVPSFAAGALTLASGLAMLLGGSLLSRVDAALALAIAGVTLQAVARRLRIAVSRERQVAVTRQWIHESNAKNRISQRGLTIIPRHGVTEVELSYRGQADEAEVGERIAPIARRGLWLDDVHVTAIKVDG